MNIGIYLKSLSDDEIVKIAIESIEKGMDDKRINDASIFYDSIGFSPYFFPCGVFNSTDLWNFSGKLVAFSLDCLNVIKNTVNNFDVYYCYGFEKDNNVLRLLDLVKDDTKIITKDEQSSKTYYRLTGKNSIGSLDNEDLLQIIGE